MSVIRSALDESRPLGSDFGSKPSFADPSLTWPIATVTASNGTAVNQTYLAVRIDEKSQECITDITIVKQGGVRWNREETKRSVPSRDVTSLERLASPQVQPAWRRLFQRHS
jgi:hypothetical protein